VAGAPSSPQPETNAIVNGFEVDALYRSQRLIIELDAYGTHGDTVTFQSDRDRDFDTLDLGYDTIRLTRERLTDPIAQRLRHKLDEGGGGGGGGSPA
jgi:very-short-patch-repair endonuclease